MNVRDFLPPIAIKLVQKIVMRSGQKTYATYEAALAECTEHAYEDSDIVEVVLQKTMRYRDEIAASGMIRLTPTHAFSLCSLLALINSNEIHVIDFGGACGAHYFLARAILPKSVKLKWIVVETPEMADRAASILSNDELSFSSDLESSVNALNRIDLFHTSGTLQCVAKPYEYFTQIVSTSAHYILFNRLGLTKGNQDVITVHESWLSWNGPGPMPQGIQDKKVRYPFVFLREDVFYRTLQQHYDIVMVFDEDSGVSSARHEALIGGGIVARLKRTGTASIAS